MTEPKSEVTELSASKTLCLEMSKQVLAIILGKEISMRGAVKIKASEIFPMFENQCREITINGLYLEIDADSDASPQPFSVEISLIRRRDDGTKWRANFLQVFMRDYKSDGLWYTGQVTGEQTVFPELRLTQRSRFLQFDSLVGIVGRTASNRVVNKLAD